jgi:hypothetical protein
VTPPPHGLSGAKWRLLAEPRGVSRRVVVTAEIVTALAVLRHEESNGNAAM